MEDFKNTCQAFFYIFCKCSTAFFNIAVFQKFSHARIWRTTKSDQAFAHFIQGCIQAVHVFVHFWMPNHKATSTHIPVYLVKGNVSDVEVCYHLVQDGFCFWKTFFIRRCKSCYISSCFMFHSCHVISPFYNDSN